MTIKRCPGCSAIMEQLPRTVGGVTSLYWVCPEGDWEEPVKNAVAPSGESEPEATPDGAA